MKANIASLFGVLAVFMLVASLIIPGNQANTVAADAGISRWGIVNGPNATPFSTDISSPHSLIWSVSDNSGFKGSEVHKVVAAGDGKTVLAGIIYPVNSDFTGLAGQGIDATLLASPLWLGVTTSIAINWDHFPYWHLAQEMRDLGWQSNPVTGMFDQMNVWNMAIAPDDPEFWAVVTSGPVHGPVTAGGDDAPLEVFVTTNAGASWQRTNFATAYRNQPGGPYTDGYISCVDISPGYGNERDIAVGIRNGYQNNNGALLDLWILQSDVPSGWRRQDQSWPSALPSWPGGSSGADMMALKFSPTYFGDASLSVVFSDNVSTFFDIAIRDLDQNVVLSWVNSNPVEVKGSFAVAGASPGAAAIITADLELPSDFSGQSPSLRRAYVSTDGIAYSANSTGIFRIDDTAVYTLMDTTGQDEFRRRASSIAYYGTYASGKLLAGEVIGDSCSATVMTWFTDTPTQCGGSCWFPALKPATGSAGSDNNTMACTTIVGDREYGNAQVAWLSDGTLAYAGTGFYIPTIGFQSNEFSLGLNSWYQRILPQQELARGDVPRFWDETALSISRNNGETWNQINYIDTNLNQNPPAVGAVPGQQYGISWLNDVAVAPDCTTIYLASVSQNATHPCIAFDSVWRASVNPAVAAPLPAISPIGFYWERVYTRPTAINCEQEQTDLPLLRISPDMTDGQVIGWASQNTRAQAWSPDYGDFWANITPRNNIQDFAFESSTMLWNLSPTAQVQMLPYTGIAWSGAEPDIDSKVGSAHMIAVKPEGKIIVGATTLVAQSIGAIGYSLNSGNSFNIILEPLPADAGNVHVAFDTDFYNNSIVYIGDDGPTGRIYRYQLPFPVGGRWIDNDMMGITNGNAGSGVGVPHMIGYFGLQVAITGGALYGAHAPVADDGQISGVERTLWPTAGMPKPGVVWDCLNVFVPAVAGVSFTTEPWSLKLCGCLTMNSDTVLYSLDHQTYNVTGNAAYRPGANFGVLWAFTDCFAKKGPTLITADGTLIGCDPVSGRAQEVNLCWEQLCVARGYDLEISKNADFTIRIIDWAGRGEDNVANFLQPVNLLEPCVYFPAGGNSDIRSSAIGVVDAVGVFGDLECGHRYFWRVMVREAATAQIIRSPWSEVRSFTIKAGLPVRADYYGLKLLSPDNGCIGCPVQPASFSWSPFKETSKYKFVLATDATMTSVVAEAEVATTAYEYEGTLDYSTNYFWRVRSLEPAPSDWSATFSLQTEAAPAPPSAPEAVPPIPLWVLVVITIGAILVLVTLVLIIKAFRV